MIGPQSDDLVHVVELFQSGLALVAVVADHLANDRPVFLLDLCELRDYADEAGFTSCEVLPIEHDFWRFYLLRP